MALSESDLGRLHELLSALSDGRLDEAQAATLRTMLVDPAAQQYYVNFGMLDACLDLASVESARPAALPFPVTATRPELASCRPNAGSVRPKDQVRSPATRSPVLGFLRKALHVSGDTPMATALMWMVMALCTCGVVLTFAFVTLILHGINVHVDRPFADKAPNLPSPSRKGAGAERGMVEVSAPSSTVARLTRTVDCIWTSRAKVPQAGDDLAPGRKLVLQSGLAEIIFQGGVRTVLQGPATLEVQSRMSAYLGQGKFTVKVEDPLVKGFVVYAPGMKYTDLGTEFGVSVAQNGAQEVHVFRGTVQVEAAGIKDEGSAMKVEGKSAADSGPSSLLPPSSSFILSANQAIRIAAPDKPIEQIAADARRFVRTQQMTEIAAEQSPDFRRWKKSSEELSQRPDLLAYYDFQPDKKDRGVLRNRAATGRQYDGRLIGGAKWCEGRLSGKQALEFVERGSGVRVNLPLDCQQLTLVAWVRKQRGRQLPLAAILNSDDFRTRAGAVHWQFVTDRKSFFMDVSRGAKQVNVIRPTDQFNRAAALDRWCMYAETFDATTLSGNAYFNGKPVGRETFGEVQSARIGPATIGGFVSQPPVDKTDNRVLGGDIDELMIFKSVIAEDEIAQFYQYR